MCLEPKTSGSWNSQTVRVALIAKDLILYFFLSFFCTGVVFPFFFFFPLCTLFQVMAASRSLFELQKWSQYLVVTRAACAHKFYILTHLNFLVKSINTWLVFNHKWERYGLVVTQFFEGHHDVFLERPSLKVCQIPLCPRSLGGFTVGMSLCCPFQLHTAVICELSTPSAAQNGFGLICIIRMRS